MAHASGYSRPTPGRFSCTTGIAAVGPGKFAPPEIGSRPFERRARKRGAGPLLTDECLSKSIRESAGENVVGRDG
jgi:hypothetical protein